MKSFLFIFILLMTSSVFANNIVAERTVKGNWGQFKIDDLKIKNLKNGDILELTLIGETRLHDESDYLHVKIQLPTQLVSGADYEILRLKDRIFENPFNTASFKRRKVALRLFSVETLITSEEPNRIRTCTRLRDPECKGIFFLRYGPRITSNIVVQMK